MYRFKIKNESLVSLMFLLIVFSFAGSVEAASKSCSDLFISSALTQNQNPLLKNGPHAEIKMVIGSTSLNKWARSNSPHFWTWAEKNKSKYLPADLLQYEGIVHADPHNGNFGPAFINGQMRWINLDTDFVLKKPLILGFVQFLEIIKGVDSAKKVQSEDLWKAYLRGLSGREAKEIPEIVEDTLNLSEKNYRDLEVQKASKFSYQDRLINDGERTTKLTNPEEVQKVLEVFHQNLSTLGYQVLDIGGREKEGGGSGSVDGEGGVLRYIALVKGLDGRNTLFEIKEDVPTPINNLSLEDVVQNTIYGEHGQDPHFKVVSLNLNNQTKKFVLRPKPIYFYDYANKAKTKSQYKEFKDLALYNAWFVGHLQSQSPSSQKLVEKLKNDQEDSIFEAIKEMSWSYLSQLAADRDAALNKKVAK